MSSVRARAICKKGGRAALRSTLSTKSQGRRMIGAPFHSLARRQSQSETHRRSQRQNLGSRSRDESLDSVGERQLTFFAEKGRKARPRTEPHIARHGSPGHHAIPKRLTLQF